MYLLIIALPLLSSIVSGLFGRFLGGKGAGFVSTICVATAFFLSC